MRLRYLRAPIGGTCTLLCTAIFLLSSLSTVYSINCKNSLSMSLGADCTLAVTADLVMADPLEPGDTYDIRVTYRGGIEITDDTLRLKHVGSDIMVWITCLTGTCGAGSSCMTIVDLKADVLPGFGETLDTTVHCLDSFLLLDPKVDSYPFRPAVLPSCDQGGAVEFVADWVRVVDCDFGNDTAKVIYREWAAFSKQGTRVVVMDTINVLKLPSIEMTIACTEQDTSYCESLDEPFGPYLVVGDDAMACDTIYLLGPEVERLTQSSKCGLLINVDAHEFETTCGEITKYKVSVIQTCYRDDAPVCTVTNPIPPGDISGGMGEPILATCEFWHMVLDTTPPVVECILKDTIIRGDTIIGLVTASSHDCEAEALLPPALITDNCNGVERVKAKVAALNTTISYRFNPTSGRYEATGTITLPFHHAPYEIIIEALDSCHNIGRDTCYILVKDLTPPTAVSFDTLNIGLTSKKIWIPAEKLNNASWDNCVQDDLLLFARRTDWREFCMDDLCDNLQTLNGFDCVELSDDETADPVQAHYRNWLQWLSADGQLCSDLLLDAWQLELCRIGEVDCRDNDLSVFLSDYADSFDIDNIEMLLQLGGGWTDAFPIGCEDLCGTLTAELLVMDYWCNWSLGWTEINVEDKAPPVQIAQLQDSIELSCTAFETDASFTVPGQGMITLDSIVTLVKEGSDDALAVIDATFGTCLPVCRTADGILEDLNGNRVGEEFGLVDRGRCVRDTMDVITIDSVFSHDDECFIRVDTMYPFYRSDTVTTLYQQGLVLAGCGENLQMSQQLNRKETLCGLGEIERVIKLWKFCPGQEKPTLDTVTCTQIIEIKNFCEFDQAMFECPADIVLPDAGCPNISVDMPEINPANMTAPVYLGVESCRNIEILPPIDAVKTIMGGSGCQPGGGGDICPSVIERTWILVDLCTNERDTCIQKITFEAKSDDISRVTPKQVAAIAKVDAPAPNPFKLETLLGLDLPAASEVQVLVADLHGRVQMQQRQTLDAGHHQWSISGKELGAPGIYTYVMLVDGMIEYRGKLVYLE